MTGGNGWGNAELEYYTPGPQNARLDGHGHLALTAQPSTADLNCWYGRCRYVSARLTTRDTSAVEYGRIEARMKLPIGAGLWPAFWMLGAPTAPNNWPNDGEIDVMENIGSEPSTVHGSMHGPGYSGANALGSTYTLPRGERFADSFHTFAIDWTPSSVKYMVDDHVYETLTPNSTRGNAWVFRHPFSLVLNLAVGGTWPGSPSVRTQLPATLLVDYVAVYKN